MSYEIIDIPEQYQFITEVPEFQQDLPDNVYIDKVSTGCGATFAVLTNDVNYVVVVPFIALGENKVDQSEANPGRGKGQYPHKLFMLSGKVSNEDFYKYIRESGDVKKILVTYDSLPRLIDLINPKDYKIFIDEAHKLIEYAGNFKPKVVYNLLDSIHLFKSYVLCTATPTKEKYLPEKVKGMRKVKLNWKTSKRVNINHIRLNQNQLRASVISLCLQYLRGELEGNIYLFYNSVTSIARICKDLVNSFGYSHKDINVICSETEKNKKTLKSINKDFYPRKPIEKDEDGVARPNIKKVNFITSTAFEGQDFWDKMGKTYIVSDGKLDHTKLDIATQISQIIGRLRDSIHKDNVTLLWTASPTLGYKTIEEYEVYIDRKQQDSETVVLDFNMVQSDTTKGYIIKGITTDPFLLDNSEDEVLDIIANPDVKNHLLNVYEGTEQQYYVNIKESGVSKDVEEYVEHTLKDVYLGNIESNFNIKPLSNADKMKLGYKGSYRDVAKTYITTLLKLGQKETFVDWFVEELEQTKTAIETDPRFEVIVEYISIFGVNPALVEGCSAKLGMSYLSKRIDRYKEKLRLQEVLRYKYNEGDLVTNEELREELEHLYQVLDLKGKLKLSDINLAFETSPTKHKGKNAFRIVSTKLQNIKTDES